jgi:hypothetical protein
MERVRCAVPEHPRNAEEFDERCRRIEQMLRERDPGEGFEWPAADEPERPEPPKERHRP